VLHDALPDNVRGKSWRIRAKQLYHDREEITVVALPPLGQREASHRD
jgi:23S rRNA C2498 (ribose-2'-O)-methylase RlmM